jgi:hypothetical protein
MKYEIYKEHYKFEWDHRSHISTAMNVPIAVATVLGGAVTVMAQKYPYTFSTTSYMFVIAVAIAVMCIFLSIFFLFKAIHGYNYKRIPTPLKLKSYYDELLDWHEKYGNGKESAEHKFDEYFYLRIGEATEVNAHNNKNKSAYLYRCNTSLAFAVVFIALSSIPFLIDTINGKEKTYSVRILSPTLNQKKEIAMSDNEPTTNEAPPEPPPEPVMPPNENIKESVVEPVIETTVVERKE